ncbi:MAG: hypothetical protein AAF466_12620 [Bacteroidota bacterium]
MKKLTPIFVISLFVLLLTGCEQDMTTRSVKGVYEIDVPNDMSAAKGLNIDASMQYENIFNESYLAIIDEDKEDFESAYSLYGKMDTTKSVIANYAQLQVDFFSEGVNVIDKGEFRSIRINGMDAEQIEFTAAVEGVDSDIYYLMTFIEGEKNVYMVMTWTLIGNKGEHQQTFVRMADSFREL